MIDINQSVLVEVWLFLWIVEVGLFVYIGVMFFKEFKVVLVMIFLFKKKREFDKYDLFYYNVVFLN